MVQIEYVDILTSVVEYHVNHVTTENLIQIVNHVTTKNLIQIIKMKITISRNVNHNLFLFSSGRFHNFSLTCRIKSWHHLKVLNVN
jgi:hypothetical protein